jgi:hypothetical protein
MHGECIKITKDNISFFRTYPVVFLTVVACVYSEGENVFLYISVLNSYSLSCYYGGMCLIPDRVYVILVLERVAMGQAFLRVLTSFLVGIIPLLFMHTFIKQHLTRKRLFSPANWA